MKISAILLLSLVLLGTTAAMARAEEPQQEQKTETATVPYHAGAVVMPESADDSKQLSDNLTPVNVDGGVGYVDSNQRFVGLSN
jgi:opacity protein-like surface antigen